MNVFEKYGVIEKSRERFYKENLLDRDYYLEGTTPVYLMIDDVFISDRTWVGIIPKIALYLQNKDPKNLDVLLEFRTSWSKAQIYSCEPRTNYSPVFDGLFINTNHTALHSVWFIQDLLDFYLIDKKNTYLLIKRPPSIEPKEVKDYVKNVIKECFYDYLKEKKYDDAMIIRIIKGIESLNKFLVGISKTYNDFYLFDNTLVLANYKSRLLKEINNFSNWADTQKQTAKKYLDIYTGFCTTYFS